MSTEDLKTLYEEACSTLGAADVSSPTAAITSLTMARDAVQAALDEAMALSVTTEGTSVRQVAALAGIAPNSAASHMARSATLSGYADRGRVSASGVTLARHDYNTQQTEGETKPMGFVRRNSKES